MIKKSSSIGDVLNETRPMRKNVTVIIMRGLPGLGKTTFIRAMMSKYHKMNRDDVQVVNTDLIRVKAMDEIAKQLGTEGKELSAYELEQVTRHQVEEYIKNEIGKTFVMLDEGGVFILDKNTVDEQMRDFIIKEATKNFENVEKQFMVPYQVDKEFIYDDVHYPFSMTMLVTSLIRCLRRKGHPTLRYGPENTIRAIILCYKKTAGLSFEKFADEAGMTVVTQDFINDMVREEMTVIYDKIRPLIDRLMEDDIDDYVAYAAQLMQFRKLVKALHTWDAPQHN